MLRRLILYLLVPWGMLSAQSPYKTNIFIPGWTATASSQTSPSIPLGTSYSVGTITLTGSSLTTATFAVMGSSNGGATYTALPISAIADPTTTATTITATAAGLYQVNLATITHIKFVTSGTFTATSVTLLLTGAPNGSLARGGGGGGGGAPLPCDVSATNYACLDATGNVFTGDLTAASLTASGGSISGGAGGQVQLQADGVQYSDLTFNGSHTNGTRLGFVAANNADENFYMDVPDTGVFKFRISNVVKAIIGNTIDGAVSTLASATTIAPLSSIVNLTGTSAIATISLPNGVDTFNGTCITFLPASTVLTTTAGNIAAIYTLLAGKLYQGCFNGTSWFFLGSGI